MGSIKSKKEERKHKSPVGKLPLHTLKKDGMPADDDPSKLGQLSQIAEKKSDAIESPQPVRKFNQEAQRTQDYSSKTPAMDKVTKALADASDKGL